MRATIFVQEGKVEAKVIDSSKDFMFLVMSLDTVEFFFPNYGQKNIDYVRDLIEKLTVAADIMQNKVFESEQPSLRASEDDYMVGDFHPVTGNVLTRTEIHQGQADMGRDTWDEHDEKV